MDFLNKINEIANTEQPLQRRALTFLSDISIADAGTLRLAWPGVALDRRRAITRSLVELAEDNIDFNFSRFFQVAADDPDAEVRETSIEGLWEDNSYTTLRMLIDRLRSDPEPRVRTAAALALARFTYLSEIGKLRDEWPAELRSILMETVAKEVGSTDVRRRAVEALSYLSNDAEVTDMLEQAYAGGGKMKVSALLGMGRNMDQRWEPTLLQELKSEDPELRYEAARALGEHARNENVPALLPLLVDEDLEVRLGTIWALGQLGGQLAERALVALSESDENAVVEAAENALEELRYDNDRLSP
jgi:HEAT repeat protein